MDCTVDVFFVALIQEHKEMVLPVLYCHYVRASELVYVYCMYSSIQVDCVVQLILKLRVGGTNNNQWEIRHSLPPLHNNTWGLFIILFLLRKT